MDSWRKFSTPGFELITTSTGPEARDLLRAVQDADSFFRKIGLAGDPDAPPVRIYAFQTKADYADFQLTAGAFGHYIHGRSGDFIVLEDIRPQHREAGIHEYTHVALQRAGLKLPIWLNEGLADVYSSLLADADQVIVGAPIAARSKALERYPWLDLNALLTMPSEHLLYQEGARISIFYGQSWALAHMLLFSSDYRLKFPEFLHAVSSGTPSAEAFQTVYGRDLATVAQDLQHHWRDRKLRAVRLNVRLDPPADGTVATLTHFESSVELAKLLAAAPSTAHKAGELLSALLQESPGDAQVQQQLAELTRRYPRAEAAVPEGAAGMLEH